VLLTLEFFSSKLCSSCHKLKSIVASFPEDTFLLHVNRLVSSTKCVFEPCHHWSKSHFCCPYFPEFTAVGCQWNTIMVSCFFGIYGSYVMEYNQSSVVCLHACVCVFVFFWLMEMACIFLFCILCSMTVDVSPWYNGNIILGLH